MWNIQYKYQIEIERNDYLLIISVEHKSHLFSFFAHLSFSKKRKSRVKNMSIHTHTYIYIYGINEFSWLHFVHFLQIENETRQLQTDSLDIIHFCFKRNH